MQGQDLMKKNVNLLPIERRLDHETDAWKGRPFAEVKKSRCRDVFFLGEKQLSCSGYLSKMHFVRDLLRKWKLCFWKCTNSARRDPKTTAATPTTATATATAAAYSYCCCLLQLLLLLLLLPTATAAAAAAYSCCCGLLLLGAGDCYWLVATVRAPGYWLRLLVLLAKTTATASCCVLKVGCYSLCYPSLSYSSLSYCEPLHSQLL